MSEIDLDAYRPKLKVHDMKKQQDTEIKQLAKSTKGKAYKEKEKEVLARQSKEMEELVEAWKVFRLAEAGEQPVIADAAVTSVEESKSLYVEHDVNLSKSAKKRIAREKREAEEEERLREAMSKLPNMRAIEQKGFVTRLACVQFDGLLADKKGATIREIKGDGHCMYRAIADQQQVHAEADNTTSAHTYVTMRELAAAFIRAHKEDFLPYLLDEDADEIPTLEEVDGYCDQIAECKGDVVWGGQAELVAISQALGNPITIHTYDAPPIECGKETKKGDKPTLHVSFHKHLLGLGDHYNSVIPAGNSPIDEEDEEE